MKLLQIGLLALMVVFVFLFGTIPKVVVAAEYQQKGVHVTPGILIIIGDGNSHGTYRRHVYHHRRNGYYQHRSGRWHEHENEYCECHGYRSHDCS